MRGTKRDAEGVLRVLVPLERGPQIKPNKVALGEWPMRWLKDYGSMCTSDRTEESCSSGIERCLIPSLGKVALIDLQLQRIQSCCAEKLTRGRADGRGGLSARSVVYHGRIVSKALNYGVRVGMVVRGRYCRVGSLAA